MKRLQRKMEMLKLILTPITGKTKGTRKKVTKELRLEKGLSILLGVKWCLKSKEHLKYTQGQDWSSLTDLTKTIQQETVHTTMHKHANTPKSQPLGSSDFTVVKRVYGHVTWWLYLTQTKKKRIPLLRHQKLENNNNI